MRVTLSDIPLYSALILIAILIAIIVATFRGPANVPSEVTVQFVIPESFKSLKDCAVAGMPELPPDSPVDIYYMACPPGTTPVVVDPDTGNPHRYQHAKPDFSGIKAEDIS